MEENNAMPLVSIVAPAYNIEKYLKAFVDSVLSQTYSNWELILVDDGSTDSCGSVCDDYAQKDSRISVIHQANGGLSNARNVGIKQSKGEWILISDPDDMLLPDGIASMVECIREDIDLISASYFRYVNGVLSVEKKASVTTVMPLRQYIEEIGISPRSHSLDRYVWNKMYKSSIIKNNSIFFDEDLRLFEDVCYVYRYLAVCKQGVMCSSKPFYSYFRRTEGTAMMNRNNYREKTLDWLKAYIRSYHTVKGMNVPGIVKKRIKKEVFDVYHQIIRLIRKEKKGKEEEKKANELLQTCFTPQTIFIYNCRYMFSSLYNKMKKCIRKTVRPVVL